MERKAPSDAPIRVLVVDGKLICGGVEAFLINVFKHIDRSKVVFDFLTHYKGRFFYDDVVESLGGKVFRLSFRDDKNLIKYKRDLDLFFKEHREYKIVWGNMDGLASFYLKAAKKNGCITICHSHVSSAEKTLKGLIKRLLRKDIAKYADYCWACSKEAGNYLYGKRKFDLVNNGIDCRKYDFDEYVRTDIRRKNGWSDEMIVIGHVGRFFYPKNQEFIVSFFEKIISKDKRYRLCFCGEGDDMEKIKQSVGQKGLSQYVLFAGNVSDMHHMYQAFDVFVLPSFYEGLPVSGVEAQASGLKCIFSENVPHGVRLIDENVKFLPIEGNGASDIWCDEIVGLDTSNRRACAKEIIEKGFDINCVCEKLVAFFESLNVK